MKLLRFGPNGLEKPGLQLDDGRRIDVSSIVKDYDEAFFAGNGLDTLLTLSENVEAFPDISPTTRLGPPIARPSKIICVGLNYAQHARESNLPLPTEPVLFMKATTAICGPFDDIFLPPGSTKTDWEVELGVVIGREAKHISAQNALDHVAGYLIHNDVSERAHQLEKGGQWVKGKSADTFAPLGPYLVSQQDVPEPGNLDLWLKVNDQTVQQSNTSDMVFDIPYLIAYISRFMTLLPGDLISTGTPAGVGLGFDPPRYLKPGDVVELGIDQLGMARQVVQDGEPG